MIIVSWNIRGLGSPEKKSAVRKLLRQNKVDVLLLKEFKIHKKKKWIVLFSKCGVLVVADGSGFFLNVLLGGLLPFGMIMI